MAVLQRFGSQYLLYNWEVAQKACPLGWYLPSKSDYDRLLSFVGNTKKERYEALIKGGSAGFESLQVGALATQNFVDGIFWGKQLNSFYWTSTEKKPKGDFSYAYILGIRGYDKKSSTHAILKTYAVSVRCLKK